MILKNKYLLINMETIYIKDWIFIIIMFSVNSSIRNVLVKKGKNEVYIVS